MEKCGALIAEKTREARETSLESMVMVLEPQSGYLPLDPFEQIEAVVDEKDWKQIRPARRRGAKRARCLGVVHQSLSPRSTSDQNPEESYSENRRISPLWGGVLFMQEFAVKYTVLIEESEEGFAVSVPGLPGCQSQGETEAESLANIKDAICEYRDVVEELAASAGKKQVAVEV